MTINKLKTLIIGKRAEPSSSFSAFFIDSKAKDKKKLIEEVVRKANEDQRRLVETAETIA
jgi:hypothetical protein